MVQSIRQAHQRRIVWLASFLGVALSTEIGKRDSKIFFKEALNDQLTCGYFFKNSTLLPKDSLEIFTP
jgi:hypothetical protein